MLKLITHEKTRRRILLGAFVACILLTLCLVGIIVSGDDTGVVNARTESSGFYTQRPAARRIEEKNTPLGVVLECRLPINDRVTANANLMFYTYHQYVDVYIGQEHVFSLYPPENCTFTKTVGSSWVKIPIYEQDRGDDIRVILTPVYEYVRERVPDFMIGSELDIFMHQFREDFLQLLISTLLILFGVVVIIPAGILREEGVLALCLSAIMIGSWRMLDTLSITLLIEGHALLIYYMSLLMLMGVGIPIANAVKNRRDRKSCLLFEAYALVTCLLVIVLLAVQLMGLVDLRQTLWLAHVVQIAGGLLILGNLIYVDKKAKGGAWLRNRKITFCSLAVAAFLDLALFYVTGKSDHLVVTPLAYIVIVAVYSVRLLTKYLNQQMLLKDRENQLLQSRTTVALGQIRSHFIFNLLNAISGMCKSNPAKADETIVCFSRYLRANIDILQSDKLMPFYQILETLEDYIVLEQVRFGDRIAFEADIEEDDFLMPPLVLQPIVENAIKHGLTAKVEGGTIWLSTRSDSNWVYITVTDDGVGFQQHELHKDGSVGLRNVRFRLKHMVNGHMTIESTPGQGTSVQIMIPRKDS